MTATREQAILDFLTVSDTSSSKEIFDACGQDTSYATVKRLLTRLAERELIEVSGQGKATRYSLSGAYRLLSPIDLDSYFKKEIDERKVQESFNFELLPGLMSVSRLFSGSELSLLDQWQSDFEKNVRSLSKAEYRREFERLAIDLSWKSSQIEGNTYSLLETEKLLKERQTASGKTKEEATMLLNHKEALDFIIDHPNFLESLTVAKIESIHTLLVKELNVETNLRRRRVGISGTNYRPLDNEFQIREALEAACRLINSKHIVFEKALLALVLISYIQPFVDGNKRTARIVSNAILINSGYCPLSFRTVDSIDYKKAILLFYEQNNLSSFKQIFIEQFEFAVKTYF